MDNFTFNDLLQLEMLLAIVGVGVTGTIWKSLTARIDRMEKRLLTNLQRVDDDLDQHEQHCSERWEKHLGGTHLAGK